jgi:hypothetical protein
MSTSLPATQDTKIHSGSYGNWDYGIAAVFGVNGTVPPNRSEASLIRVDVSGLEEGLSIASAILRLYINSGDGARVASVGMHRMLVEWYEGNKNGAPADGTVDSSVWNKLNYKTGDDWPGGAGMGSGTDFAALPTDSAGCGAAGEYVEWDVTADVQAFYEGSATNYGWAVINATDDILAGKGFGSRHNSTPAYRPELIVEMGGPPPTMTVEPPVVIAQGQTVDFILFGNNTSWEAGLPGTPEFETDVGTVVFQRVVGPYLAYIQVELPTSTDNMVITDPDANITATVDFLGPDNMGEDLATILAAIEGLQTQMKRLLLGGGSTDSDIATQLQKIIDAFSLDAEEPDQNWPDSALAKLEAIWPIGTDPDANLADNMTKVDQIHTWVSDVHTDVQTLVGDPAIGLHDIDAKIDALDALTQDDLDAAVLAIKGTNGPTALQVKAAVDAIPTNPITSLEPVTTPLGTLDDKVDGLVTDLGTIKNTTLPAISGKVDGAELAARMALAMSLLPLLGETAGAGLDLVSLAGDVVSMLGDAATVADVIHDWGDHGGQEPVFGLNPIAVKLQAIENELLAYTAQRQQPAPWPGLANVTKGTPVAFSGPDSIEAEMDGAIINLTVVPSGHGGGENGLDRPYYWRIGWYAFADDDGHIEQPRWLTTDELVTTPLHILRPTAIVISCPNGVEGVVTPWTSEI